MKLYIGIDPGASGGISAIRWDGAVHLAIKMPETDLDLLEVFEMLRSQYDEAFALIERVHSMPGQGVASSFSFGEGYGKLQMALCAAKIPYERIQPAKWQKALGCLTKGDKNVSKRKAQELFPNTKMTHAIADAILIAEYARRERL
jgi:crossover junction endodeoxyribonuclease RuvC